MPASFKENLSRDTIDHMNTWPTKTWVMYMFSEKKLVFREGAAGANLIFTVSDHGIVRMVIMMTHSTEWEPFANKLHHLLSTHDVLYTLSPEEEAEARAAEARDAKVAELMAMDYKELIKLYRARATNMRRGLKMDRASVARRLSKDLL